MLTIVMRSHPKTGAPVMRRCVLVSAQAAVLALLLLPVRSTHAQTTSLKLSSGSAVQGGSASLSLSLNALAGSAPSSLQWTLSYMTSDIASLTFTTGPALTAAGKWLNCRSGSGSARCLATSMDANPINSGVVAVITVKLAPITSAPTVLLSIGDVAGALAGGTPLTVSGTGGGISILPTVSSVQCSPSRILSRATSTCTVTLSAGKATGSSTVTLAADDRALAVPAAVSVAAGASSAIFRVKARSVTNSRSFTITASLNGVSATASLDVRARK